MKIMGLDYGEARTGVALSDELGMMAHGLESIEHKGNDKKLLERICEIIKANKVSKIVIGYPLNMNGTVGMRAEICLDFKKMIEEQLNVSVDMEDERLTSVISNQILIEADLSRKKRKKKVDGLAAQLILQSYLDRKGGIKNER